MPELLRQPEKKFSYQNYLSEKSLRNIASLGLPLVSGKNGTKKRDSVEDRSQRPHNLQTNLTPDEEIIVVELRKTLLLPLDDLLTVVREFIRPEQSRSALDRCLRRHGVSNLKQLIPAEEGEKKTKKAFENYEPGFVHVDIKYLPKMSDEVNRKYLFVGIDRATRWVFFEFRASKTAESARSFLKHIVIVEKAPFKISKVLTDNGKEFTDRFCATGQRNPTGRHIFDKECSKYVIEHRLIPPRHPQTNGMVERFNGRISDVINQTTFSSSKQLKKTLLLYLRVYNHHIPQKNLGHITPVDALKNWKKTHPDLFKKSIYNHTGLDI